MKHRLFFFLAILLIFHTSLIFSQDVEDTAPPQSSVYPQAYRNISLGMDMDTVKQELLADSLFGYRGDRDVSLLSGENRSLIETVGYSFIRRSWFQFLENRLYVMTFNLDFSRVDYYSLYSSLVAKYGEPSTLDPKKAVWKDESTMLSLERPLTIKYIDLITFNTILEEAGTEKATSDILRENFIREF